MPCRRGAGRNRAPAGRWGGTPDRAGAWIGAYFSGHCVAVFWAAEGPEAALPFGAVLLAFTALVHFGRRRSNTLEVMSGTGDERVRSLYMQAVAIAGTVMSFVLPGWWLVTVAQGEPNDVLSALCAIFGVTFVVAIVVLARRN